jgi:hypothetical protein
LKEQFAMHLSLISRSRQILLSLAYCLPALWL